MIKNIFIILLFLILCHGSAEAGQEIVVIQSLRVKPYEKAIEGFKSVCNSKIKRLVVSESEGADVVEKISKIRPDMVLAVGMDALSRVKKIKNIPVVYLMVLNPPSILSGKKNITGVTMKIPQEKQLITLLKALPDTKNIGLLYDPDRTGHFVKKAQAAAKKIGIKLIAKEIHSSRDVPSLVMNMKGKIDLFWMLPDLTVVTPETVEFLLLFSLENRVPLLTFSEKYVALGALMSIGIDAFDMGRQAGEMAKKILLGRNVKGVQPVDARKAVVSINLKVAKKLEITIDKKIMNNARIIE